MAGDFLICFSFSDRNEAGMLYALFWIMLHSIFQENILCFSSRL
jgi:hypothetical protein